MNNTIIPITLLLLSFFNIPTYAKSPSNSLKLTSAEKKFLLQHSTIKIHTEKEWSPYNYTQFKKAKGYSNEYMELLASKLGIKLKYIYGKNIPTYIKMLKQKQIDIISNIQPKNIKNNAVLFSTKPIISVPMSILTKKNQVKYSEFKNLGHKKIAITKDMFSIKGRSTNYTSLIKKNYLNIKFIYKSDIKKIISMVLNDSASAAVATYGFFNHYIKHNNIKGLISTPIMNNPYIKPLKYHIAIRKDFVLLKSALDKAMKAVSAKELKYLNNKWLSPKKITNSASSAIVKKIPSQKPLVKKVTAKPAIKKAPPLKTTVKKVTSKPIIKTPPPKSIVKEVIAKPTIKTPLLKPLKIKEEVTQNKKMLPNNIDSKKEEINNNETKNFFQNITSYMIVSAIAALLLIILFFAYISKVKAFSKLKTKADELKEQQDDIINASKAKSNHLAQISHEIRTPINAVLGMSTLALKTNLDDKQHGYVSKIHNSANILLSLVNQVLDFSKLEAGKMPLNIEEFNLNSVFENLSDIIHIKADEKGLDIIFDVDNEVPVYLLGDPMRINQILINLTSNALKFTEKGEIFVYAKLLKKEKKKVLLEFIVKDTGIGIKKEQLKKLFKEYQQAEDSTASTYGGTGLGLIISKNLINQMGGEIQIESIYKEGTSFIFTLNLDLPEKNEQRKYRLKSKESMNKKILIIDVSKASSRALHKKLDYFHFEITLCESWHDALKAFENNSGYFDLIFVNAKTFKNDSLKNIIERLSKEPSHIIFIAYNLSQLSKEDISKIKSPIFLEHPYSHQRLFDLLVDIEVDNNKKDKVLKSKLNLETISSRKILLVEDNKINQSIVQGMLDGADLKITIANNGLEALKTLHKDSNFDLILMDINMPVMNGYEAVKMIKKDSDLDSIPIVAISANILQSDILASKEAGMDAHLGKPIIIDELFKMLLKYIKPKQKNEKIVLTEKVIIDIQDGTQRVGGNFNFYKIIISDFNKEYKSSTEKLKLLLEEQDKQKAKLYLHDVKGVSANISAKRFYEFTSALEYVLHNNEADDFEWYLKAYEEELSKLIKAIDKVLIT